MDKIIAKSNENYLNVNASINTINDVSSLTINFEILAELVRPINVQINLKHFANGVYVKSFMNVKVEACDFFKATSSNLLAMNIYENLRSYGKIATRCPMKKVTEFV
jgi:hypothetical protein